MICRKCRFTIYDKQGYWEMNDSRPEYQEYTSFCPGPQRLSWEVMTTEEWPISDYMNKYVKTGHDPVDPFILLAEERTKCKTTS